MKIWVAAFAMWSSLASACADESAPDPAAAKADSDKPAQVPDASPPAPTEPAPPPESEGAIVGMHLDGVDTGYRPREYRPSAHEGKTIELFLRSSPPGANASMDGKNIGVTPTFWTGVADHQSHEFTFVKDGYAMARYRFVARQNGIVHGTLEPLAEAPGAKPAAGKASEQH